MSPTGISDIVTVEDQRAYIKIKNVYGKKPREIHSGLHEIRGQKAIDHSIDSHWAIHFLLNFLPTRK